MPRKQFDINSVNPLHITDRSHNKEQFDLPIDVVWEILTDMLRFVCPSFGLRVHAFVLMSNHYHLLCHAPMGNISRAMRYFNRESSRHINKTSGNINQVWGGRYHKCEIASHHYYMNAYKYVYQNPLRAGLVNRVDEYKYSTLVSTLGGDWMPVPIEDDLIHENQNISNHLEWLNRLPEKEHAESVRRALKRTKFHLPKVRGASNPLEQALL